MTLRYHDDIGWTSSKIISRLATLGRSLFADSNIMDLLQGEFWPELKWDLEKVAFGVQKLSNIFETRQDRTIPDHVYNWLVNFFDVHSHQIKYAEEMSTMKSISASIIQVSAIGPALYVVNGSDLRPVTSK